MKVNQPLSSLQKTVLALARRKEYVGYLDVLTAHYGFVTSRYKNGNEYLSVRFNSSSKIKAARVAVCKSFNRLVERGLVVRTDRHGVWGAVTLVDRPSSTDN